MGQQFSAQEVVAKCIKAHDPKGISKKFKTKVGYSIEREGVATRNFKLGLDFKTNTFLYEVVSDSVSFSQSVDKSGLHFMLNGSKTISDADTKKHQLTEERTKYLKDVYFYLFGLPYKIKDPGVIVNDAVENVKFNAKDSYKIKVNFDKSVGSDTWYFFIDTDTFLLNGYQFFHNETEGEFIYLEDNDSIGGLIMAKTKLWHWNKTEKHFRTDKILN